MHKKVMIIGGAGYVGSEITKACLAQGDQVMIFDNFSSGGLTRLAITDENLVIHEGSVTNRQDIAKALGQFNPDLVFHLAAIHYIPDCVRQPESVKSINIDGTLNVISALSQLKIEPKLVFASSASVYGADTPAPQQVSATPQPCDIYGHSKMIGEHIVSSRYSNYIIVRLFNVFGEDDPIPHLIPSIVKQINKPIIELGARSAKRDFVYVKDAARAFTVLSTQGQLRHTYNVGSGISYSVEQVADMIKAKSRSNAKLIFHSTEHRDVDPVALCADISDILADTDWRPTVSFEQGIESTLRAAKTSNIALHT